MQYLTSFIKINTQAKLFISFAKILILFIKSKKRPSRFRVSKLLEFENWNDKSPQFLESSRIFNQAYPIIMRCLRLLFLG